MTTLPNEGTEPERSARAAPMKPGELELLSGRRIYLCELQQYRTYEGLLEGLPTTEWNKEILQELVTKREGKSYPEGPAVLIQPAETPIEYDRTNRPYLFGIPSALPRVTCIGRFEALEPVRDDEDYDLSALVIIWLQEEWALPIDPAVLSQLRKLDWDRFAVNLCY